MRLILFKATEYLIKPSVYIVAVLLNR